MNRLIKFRFYDNILKKMCYRNPLNYDFCVIDIIPLQFTGFIDKNGKEIFEGDIVSFIDVRDCTQKKIFEIYFNNECGSWYCKNGQELCNVLVEQNNDDWKRSQNWTINNNQYLRVIGNIHENIELL